MFKTRPSSSSVYYASESNFFTSEIELLPCGGAIGSFPASCARLLSRVPSDDRNLPKRTNRGTVEFFFQTHLLCFPVMHTTHRVDSYTYPVHQRGSLLIAKSYSFFSLVCGLRLFGGTVILEIRFHQKKAWPGFVSTRLGIGLEQEAPGKASGHNN